MASAAFRAFGSGVLEHFEEIGMLDDVRVKRVGFPDAYLEHATRDEQLADIGLNSDGIAASVRHYLGQRVTQPVP